MSSILSSIGRARDSDALVSPGNRRVYRSKREIREPGVPYNLHGRIVYYCVCSASIIISGSARPARVRSELSNNCSLSLIYVHTLRNRLAITRDLEILVTTTHLIATRERYPRANARVLIEKRDETRSNPRREFYDETDFTRLVSPRLVIQFSYAAGRAIHSCVSF